MSRLWRIGLAGLLLALTLSSPAWPVGVDRDMLKDPVLEARAREVMKSLRCLVCQNQSIEESNAGLARDLRQIVRERVLAGDSNDQVRDYVVDRYGDWVLLKPPFKLKTYILWFGPLVLFLWGGYGVVGFFRRRAESQEPLPLSSDERSRLDALLGDTGER